MYNKLELNLDLLLTSASRTVNIGKFGAFHANELIGQPFGLNYEIVSKKLKLLPPKTWQEIGAHNISLDFEYPLTSHRGNGGDERTHCRPARRPAINNRGDQSTKTVGSSCFGK
jgi:Gcd10p family